MRLIGIKTCDTCRKALKSLALAEINVTFVDLAQETLSATEIAQIVENFPAKAINKASTTWRGLSDAEKARDPIGLLTDYPKLMKRPVIIDGDWTIGWDKSVQAKWLGKPA